MSNQRLALSLTLVAAAALLLELVLLRLLSVALWYPFAFVAIGTAMLGMGAAAVTFTLVPRLQQQDELRTLRQGALWLATASAFLYPVWNSLGADPVSMLVTPVQIVRTLGLVLLITTPFYGVGLFMTRALSMRPQAASTLYAADLVGGALGVLVYTVVLPRLGPGAIVIAAAIGATAATLIPTRALWRGLSAALALALFVSAFFVQDVVPLSVTANKPLAPRGGHETSWTVGSAIDVVRRGKERLLLIDGGTAVSELPYLAADVTPPKPRGLRALAHRLSPARSVLIVGSGGGVEVLAALGAQTERIVAIEIDPAINRLARGSHTGSLFSRPQVTLIEAEARSYLAANRERFDAIVAFHTISNAASALGAMGLSENYLLTQEGVRLLLDHLSPDGVLVMSRPEPQLARLAATVAHAWPYPGDVRLHMAAVAGDLHRPSFLAALVVSRRPLSAPNLEVLRSETPRLLFAPHGGGDSQTFFDDVLKAQDGLPQSAATLPYTPATLQPTSDDRPYFNLSQPWSHLRFTDVTAALGGGISTRARLEDLPISQAATLMLVGIVIALALPLLVAAYSRRSAPSGSLTQAKVAIYFSALGLAFMLLELALVQQLTRLLSMPAHALVAVVAVLLASCGVGSMVLAGRLKLAPDTAAICAVVAALLVRHAIPAMVDVGAPLSYPARVAVAVLAVAPVGFLLGAPFASALSRMQQPRLVALAWATNSMASVAGSVGALVVSSAFGFAHSALLAAGCYAIAAWASWSWQRR